MRASCTVEVKGDNISFSLAEVPDVLKRLARVVARAFYTHVDVVVVDALVYHTWYARTLTLAVGR